MNGKGLTCKEQLLNVRANFKIIKAAWISVKGQKHDQELYNWFWCSRTDYRRWLKGGYEDSNRVFQKYDIDILKSLPDTLREKKEGFTVELQLLSIITV